MSNRFTSWLGLASLLGLWLVSSFSGCKAEPESVEAEPVTLRDGDPPAGLAGEVDDLRDQGLSLAVSAEVGPLAGSGSVDALGQAGYSFPIDVPPGAGGLAPPLSLQYSSAAGDGYFGIGWGLSGYSTVHRCGDTIADDGAFVPVEFDDHDALCLDGERLVLVAGTHFANGAEYRTRRDPFSRIVLREYGGDPYFEVETRDGHIATYGEFTALDKDLVRYSWLLDGVRDRTDNAVRYTYSEVSDDGIVVAFRPRMISWTGGKVEFLADPAGRLDEARGYYAGKPYAVLDRVETIEVYGDGNVLLHTYALGYHYVGALFHPGEHEITTRSVLSSVQKCDAAGACLPATTLAYHSAAPHLEPPFEELPGMPGGIQHLDQAQQEALGWAHEAISGDFDGDLGSEILVWDPEASQFEVFRVDHGGDSQPVAGIAGPPSLPPSWEDIASDLDEDVRTIAAQGEQGPYQVQWDPIDWDLHRVQPKLGYSVINFDNDRRDDIIYPVGGGRDAWDVGYADELWLAVQGSAQGDPEHPGVSFSTLVIDDQSTDPIYNVIPVDHDGNGLTDLWLCRGQGFKTSHWVLALNEGDSGSFEFSFHDTHVGCSIHDELNLVSLRGQTQSLLVIPAYEWDPSLMQYPGDVDDYLADVDPLDEGIRASYWELRFDPHSGNPGEFVATELPRDLFQRWRDRECHNSVADAELGLPAFGAGFGHDRHVDLNGDGYEDILRAELADDPAGFPGDADTQNNIDAIKANLGPDDTWALGVTCSPSLPALAGDVVLRGYINTGEGFERSDVLYTFSGNPHANLWLNIHGGQLFDPNGDGFTDLLVPSTGLGGDWAILMGTGRTSGCGGSGCMLAEPLAMPHGWPAYTEDGIGWRFEVERGSVVSTRAAGGVLFVGAEDDEPDPRLEVAQLASTTGSSDAGLLAVVVDGLGARESFGYTCAGFPSGLTPSGISDSAHRPATSPRSCMRVVGSHTRPQGGRLGRSTGYQYGAPVFDQHGRGLVGFEAISRNSGTSAVDSYREEFDLSFDAELRDYPRAGIPVRTYRARKYTNVDNDDRYDVECADTTKFETVVSSELGGDTWFTYAAKVHRYTDDISAPPPGLPLPPPTPNCDELTPYEESFHEQTRDENGTVTWSMSDTAGGERVTTTPSDFVTDWTHWFIGKPQRVEVESCLDGKCATRTVGIGYNPPLHQVTEVTREPDAVGSSVYLHTALGYEGHGQVGFIGRSDAFGEMRNAYVEWDDDGRLPLSATDPEGHVSYPVHDGPSGVLWATVAASGLTDVTEFDGFYRPVERRQHASPTGPSDDGAHVRIEYLEGPEPEFGHDDAAMRVRTTRFGYGQRLTIELEAAGVEIRRRWKAAPEADLGFPIPLPVTPTWEGADIYVDTMYDDRGRPHRVSHPTRIPASPEFWTQTTRDVFNRPTRRQVYFYETAPRSVETWAYSHGRAIDGHAGSVYALYTDPDDKTSSTLLDVDGRVALTGDADDTLTCFGYGPFGVQRSVTRNCSSGAEGDAPTTTFVPDAIGRIISETDPLFGTVTTDYTAFGEVDVTTDAAGVVVDTDYDLLGRPLTRDDNGEGTTTWEWDTNRIGTLFASTSSDDFTRKYLYDNFGRVQEARTFGPTAADGTRLRRMSELYTYADGGRLTRVEYDAASRDPDFKVDFAYDAFGNLRSVHNADNGDLYWGSVKLTEAGQIAVEQFGNGVTTTREHKPDLFQLESARTDHDDTVLQHFNFEWSPGGDLLEREETVHDQQETFGHDDLHRLTSWTVGATTREAEYDALGNLTRKWGAGTYTYDDDGQLATTHFGTVDYDYLANGNLQAWDNKAASWTPTDKLRTLTTPAQTLSYRYDAAGIRRFRTDGQRVRVQSSELYERRYDGSVAEVRYRIPTADGRVAAQVVYTPDDCMGNACTWDTETTYIHDDHLGSANLITDTAGADIGGVNYDPWGRARDRQDWTTYLDETATDDVVAGFTGHQSELEGGLINMRGRMYDPVTARFASVDPIISAPLSSQGWTPYSYVLNQPLSLTDPSGYSFGAASSRHKVPRCMKKRRRFCVSYGNGSAGRGVGRGPRSPATGADIYGSLFGSGVAPGFNGPGLGGGSLAGHPGQLSWSSTGSTPGSNRTSPLYASLGDYPSDSPDDDDPGSYLENVTESDYSFGDPGESLVLSALRALADVAVDKGPGRVADTFCPLCDPLKPEEGYGRKLRAILGDDAGGKGYRKFRDMYEDFEFLAALWATLGRGKGSAAGGGGKAPNLFQVMGKQTGTLTKLVLKGRKPLGSLTAAQRQTAAQWYRGVAERTVGKNAGAAKRYNIARAEYLEGTRPTLEPTIIEFIKNNGL